MEATTALAIGGYYVMCDAFVFGITSTVEVNIGGATRENLIDLIAVIDQAKGKEGQLFCITPRKHVIMHRLGVLTERWFDGEKFTFVFSNPLTAQSTCGIMTSEPAQR